MAGRSWFYFCAHAELAGYVAWGKVELEDMRELVPIVKTMHARSERPYRALVDLRRVTSVDASVFEATAGYARSRSAALRSAIARFAVVHAEGVLGAIAGGYFDVVPPPYPVSVFSDAVEALGWLGCAGDAALLPEIDALVAVERAPPFLRALRGLLDDRPRGMTVGSAARHLRLAARTLQRRLREEGSSFQEELATARLRSAQRRMLESDAPLTEIAFDAGFASPAHLSTQFRKATGEAPSAWRARHRSK